MCSGFLAEHLKTSGKSGENKYTPKSALNSLLLPLYSFCVIKSQPRYKLLYTQKYFNLMPSYLFVFIILNCFLSPFAFSAVASATIRAPALCIIFFYVTRGNSTTCNLFDEEGSVWKMDKHTFIWWREWSKTGRTSAKRFLAFRLGSRPLKGDIQAESKINFFICITIPLPHRLHNAVYFFRREKRNILTFPLLVEYIFLLRLPSRALTKF